MLHTERRLDLCALFVAYSSKKKTGFPLLTFSLSNNIHDGDEMHQLRSCFFSSYFLSSFTVVCSQLVYSFPLLRFVCVVQSEDNSLFVFAANSTDWCSLLCWAFCLNCISVRKRRRGANRERERERERENEHWKRNMLLEVRHRNTGRQCSGWEEASTVYHATLVRSLLVSSLTRFTHWLDPCTH